MIRVFDESWVSCFDSKKKKEKFFDFCRIFYGLPVYARLYFASTSYLGSKKKIQNLQLLVNVW